MDKIIMTTKKTNTPYLIAGLIESLLYAGIAFYCLQLKEDMIDAWHFSYANTLNTCAIILFISAAINFLYKLSASTSFVDVYCNKITGKGIQQFIVRDFELNFEHVTDISCTGRFLYINTPAGKYKIITNATCAKEIFSHYNTIKNK